MERLESLQITEEVLDEYEQTTIEEMSVAPAPAAVADSENIQAADAEWKIETFKQGKQNTVDFIIEFKVLAMKADTDELHAIFLLKKNA